MVSKFSREVPVVPGRTVLLFIDVQHFNARPDGGIYKAGGLTTEQALSRFEYFFTLLDEVVVPNMRRLQKACRESGIEVMYSVIENLTQDGRDRSLDYKITGFNVPRGSRDARVLDKIRPADDEIIFSKTSSSVFLSTNIDYVLGNLGVEFVVMSGLVTDQCISSAVRDACDLGYLVTLITDACASYSRERHDTSLSHIQGYCRQRTTEEFLRELDAVVPGNSGD